MKNFVKDFIFFAIITGITAFVALSIFSLMTSPQAIPILWVVLLCLVVSIVASLLMGVYKIYRAKKAAQF